MGLVGVVSVRWVVSGFVCFWGPKIGGPNYYEAEFLGSLFRDRLVLELGVLERYVSMSGLALFWV